MQAARRSCSQGGSWWSFLIYIPCATIPSKHYTMQLLNGTQTWRRPQAQKEYEAWHTIKHSGSRVISRPGKGVLRRSQTRPAMVRCLPRTHRLGRCPAMHRREGLEDSRSSQRRNEHVNTRKQGIGGTLQFREMTFATGSVCSLRLLAYCVKANLRRVRRGYI